MGQIPKGQIRGQIKGQIKSQVRNGIKENLTETQRTPLAISLEITQNHGRLSATNQEHTTGEIFWQKGDRQQRSDN